MAERLAIILAAGQSTRINTRLPKVLHEVCGRPMLDYVLDACRDAGVEKIVVVVGYGKDQIIDRYEGSGDLFFVEQVEQKGTGHAVLCCMEHLEGFDGEVLVLCGDTPLIRSETLKTLISAHAEKKAAITLATTVLDHPKGYGRIVRDADGGMVGIVEENDCTAEQKKIKEVNPAYYNFNCPVLLETLGRVTPNNVRNEYYLTDALHIAIESGYNVEAVTAVEPEDSMGVNNRGQLSEASKAMQERVQDKLMTEGVTIVDPDNTWIDVRARIGQDTVIEPFTYIHGEVKIGRNCRIGPFAYVRDNTVLEDGVVLGVFTEVKDSTLGKGVQARHHNFLSDAHIGENVEIAAGVLTANFDGTKVSPVKIGKGSFVGAGSVLTAPLELKDKTYIRPGVTLSQDDVSDLGREEIG